MERNYYLDNYKVLLIVLVVFTHFFGALSGKEGLIKSFTIFNNLFYMPAFIMISGYFTKSNKLIVLIKSIFVPYLIFQIINWLLNIVVLKRETTISLFVPQFTLWYLLSLFFWRVGLKYVLKLKYPLIILIIISLIMGMDNNIGTFMSLSRTIYYFPFFLIGYKGNVDKIVSIQKTSVRIISIVALSLIFIVIFNTCREYNEIYFRGSMSYVALGQPIVLGVSFRIFCYLIALLISFCVAMLIPQGKNILSYLGGRTMSIYMWHGLVYQLIKYGTDVYSMINTSVEKLEWGMVVLILILIMGSRPVAVLTNSICRFPIERLFKENFCDKKV